MKHADNGFTFSIDLIGQIKSRGCNRLLNQYKALILIGHYTGTTALKLVGGLAHFYSLPFCFLLFKQHVIDAEEIQLLSLKHGFTPKQKSLKENGHCQVVLQY